MGPEFAVEMGMIRGLIDVVMKQSISIHKKRIDKERPQLLDVEFRENKEKISVLGHIEMFSDEVTSVATSIVKNETCSNPKATIETLKSNNIFRFLEFRKWFFTLGNTSPETRIYIELVDYLRGLCIEYLDATITRSARREKTRSKSK